MTANHLLELGLVDDIVPEPLGGAHTDPETTGSNLREHLIDALEELQKLSIEDLLKRRYEKYRALGRFSEAVAPLAQPAPVAQPTPEATGK